MSGNPSPGKDLLAVGGIAAFCVLGMACSSAVLALVAALPGVMAAEIVFFGAAPLALGRLAGLDRRTMAPLAQKPAVWAAAALAAPAAVAVAVYFEGFQETYILRFQEDLLSMYREMFSPSSAHPAVVFFAVALAPAVCEEIFFRGFLQGALARRMPPAAAVLASAALFAVTHMPAEIIPPIFMLGILLGTLRQVTGSLAAPMAAHFLNNCLAVGFAWERLGPIEDALSYGHLRFAASIAAFAGACAAAWALGRTRPAEIGPGAGGGSA